MPYLRTNFYRLCLSCSMLSITIALIGCECSAAERNRAFSLGDARLGVRGSVLASDVGEPALNLSVDDFLSRIPAIPLKLDEEADLRNEISLRRAAADNLSYTDMLIALLAENAVTSEGVASDPRMWPRNLRVWVYYHPPNPQAEARFSCYAYGLIGDRIVVHTQTRHWRRRRTGKRDRSN